MPAQSIPRPWRERIRHFTWAWFTVNMGTGALSSLAYNFPYGQGSTVLKVFFMFFFWLNLVLFILFNAIMATRYILFPEAWSKMLAHPAQSMFIGAYPMAATTLINAALILNQNWHWGGDRLLYAIWAFYWLDSALSYLIAFGMLYVMMIRQEHALHKMAAVWLLPVVTLIVASSTGGNIALALRAHSETMALVTTTFSLVMVTIGLSLALMIITIYLLRLVVHGPPDVSLILSAFIVLGPLGQGGYSLLVNGEVLAHIILPAPGETSALVRPSGQVLFSVCFAGAFVLWSMGVCWIIVAGFSIGNQLRKGPVPFSVAYWGLIFPNGVYAMLCVQLGKVLDSGFFRVCGAFWSTLTFAIWAFSLTLTIPAVIDGSIFKAPYLTITPPQAGLPTSIKTSERWELQSSTLHNAPRLEKS